MQKETVFRHLAAAGICNRDVRKLYRLGWEHCLCEVNSVSKVSMKLLGEYYAPYRDWAYAGLRWLFDLTLMILDERKTLWCLFRERGPERTRLIDLFRDEFTGGMIEMLRYIDKNLGKACRLTDEEGTLLTLHMREHLPIAEYARTRQMCVVKACELRQLAIERLRRGLPQNVLAQTVMMALPTDYDIISPEELLKRFWAGE